MTNKELWDQQLALLARMTDGLGMQVDENIKETVVGFNLNGFPTSSSCGGHVDDQLSFPYIQGKPEGEPEYRYIGEEQIIRELIERYSLTNEREIFDGDIVEQKFYELTEGKEEKDEYKNWYGNCVILTNQVQDMITRSGIKSIRLVPLYARYRVEAHDRRQFSNRQELEKAIKNSQKEFKKLTKFLKELYFS
jgi:hypothetical protein